MFTQVGIGSVVRNQRAQVCSLVGRIGSRRYASNKEQPKIQLQHLGVSVDLYVHPAKQSLPSWFSSPRMRFRGVIRRLGALFQNTVMIAQFRMKSKIKPRFQEWKNLAITNYVDANKAFVSNNLDSMKNRMSVWVYESLKNRRESIPQGTQLDWKLVKFNSTPKIMCIQPMMLPDTPLHHLMIVYRMDTKQRLAKVSPGETEAQKIDRDVVDYMAFIYDASKTPSDTIIAGSLFETPLNAPRPNPMNSDMNEKMMLLSMKEKGDIFRSPPQAIRPPSPQN